MRHAFDVHPAFAGDDERDALRGAVRHGRNVIFFFDVRAVFNQQAAHFLAQGSGLVRDQLHAQNLAGQFFHLVNRARHFHAAAFAAAARMDLRLDHPDRPAEFLSSFHCFLHGKCGDSARRGNAELAQDFLALVFVNLHEVSLRK